MYTDYMKPMRRWGSKLYCERAFPILPEIRRLCLLLLIPVFAVSLQARQDQFSADENEPSNPYTPRAVQAYRHGNYREAAREFSRARRQEPDDTELLKYEGYAYSAAAFESGRPLVKRWKRKGSHKWDKETQALSEQAVQAFYDYLIRGGEDPRALRFLLTLLDMPVNSREAEGILPGLTAKYPEKAETWQAVIRHYECVGNIIKP